MFVSLLIRLVALVIAPAVAMGALTSPTAPPPAAPAVAPPASLVVSAEPSRSGAIALDGATIASSAHIAVATAGDLREVRYWLDPAGSGRPLGPPTHTEQTAPFDFMGTACDGDSRPFDTTELPDGDHVLLSQVLARDGTTRWLQARFRVDNGPGQTSAAGAPQLLVSADPARRNPLPAAGQTVSGAAYVFLRQNRVALASVDFHVDGVVVRTEVVAPFDLAATNDDGTARPFDFSGLKPGRHAITAIATAKDGSQFVLSAPVDIARCDTAAAAATLRPTTWSTLELAARPDRLDAVPLDGAVAPPGRLAVFVAGDDTVTAVRFSVDGHATHEGLPPWDAAGTEPNGQAVTVASSVGTHVVRATVWRGDATETLEGRFVVPLSAEGSSPSSTTPTTPTTLPRSRATTTTTARATPGTTARATTTTTTSPATDRPDAAADDILDRPFAADSPWNVPIPPGARYAPTTTFAGDPGWINCQSSSMPVWFTDTADPVTTIESPQGTYQLRLPAGVTPAGGEPPADANITVVDRDHDQSIDFYGSQRTGPSSFRAALSIATPLDGSGFGSYTSGGAQVKAGVRASGASTLGGMITGPNLARGSIDHALAIAVGSQNLDPTFVAPAVGIDQGGQSSYHGVLPMGSRLAIPPTVPKPASLSPIGSLLWDAFVRYGGYVLDRADSFAIYAEPNTVSAAAVDPLNSGDLAPIVAALEIVTE
jgi:hypothetical protein